MFNKGDEKIKAHCFHTTYCCIHSTHNLNQSRLTLHKMIQIRLIGQTKYDRPIGNTVSLITFNRQNQNGNF